MSETLREKRKNVGHGVCVCVCVCVILNDSVKVLTNKPNNQNISKFKSLSKNDTHTQKKVSHFTKYHR